MCATTNYIQILKEILRIFKLKIMSFILSWFLSKYRGLSSNLSLFEKILNIFSRVSGYIN